MLPGASDNIWLLWAQSYYQIIMMLTIELVPKTCWFSNVRDHVDKTTWTTLRRQIYRKANYVCQVCRGRGPDWPVECHEIWHYDDENHVQKLVGLIALCPSCHEVKHIGLAGVKGKSERAEAHLSQVNHWTPEQTHKYVAEVWAVWLKRSQHQWQLDLTYLEHFGIKVEPKDDASGGARRCVN